MIQLLYPITPEHFDEVRNLIREFISWHRQRHADDVAFTDEYFNQRAIEEELGSLPGEYVPPRGRLWLAFYNGQPAGCVALRGTDDHVCEMKRMFVYPRFHGKGVGRELCKAFIREAKAIGYLSIKLDTSIRQEEALGLYTKMGFKRIRPAHALSEKLLHWLIFMELKI